MRVPELIALALLLGVGSYVLVRRLLVSFRHRRIVDIPNVRSSHRVPTPRGGGLAIVVFTGIGVALIWAVHPLRPVSKMLLWASGAALVAAVGWLDDLKPLPSLLRLTCHLVAAMLVVGALGAIRSADMPVFGRVDFGPLAGLLSVLWCVGLTNAYNFMDGIDGLAAGQAVCAGVGWAILGGLSGVPWVTGIGVAIAASSLGFLAHNLPPARIFMGDVGSTFLGFTLASLTVAAATASTALAIAGVLLVWPFVFDTSFTLVRRAVRGERLLQAHRTHLYQRLVITGLPHGRVTRLYVALAVLGLLLALSFVRWQDNAPTAVALTVPACSVGLWYYVTWQERRAMKCPALVAAAPPSPGGGSGE